MDDVIFMDDPVSLAAENECTIAQVSYHCPMVIFNQVVPARFYHLFFFFLNCYYLLFIYLLIYKFFFCFFFFFSFTPLCFLYRYVYLLFYFLLRFLLLLQFCIVKIGKCEISLCVCVCVYSVVDHLFFSMYAPVCVHLCVCVCVCVFSFLQIATNMS